MLSVYLSMIDTQQDRDKFERLFHQYERCLKYTAQNILGDEHLAEDAVQEPSSGSSAAWAKSTRRRSTKQPGS